MQSGPASPEPTAAFAKIVQPFASQLPTQISQRSVFVLPKPAFVAASLGGSSGDKNGSRVEDDADGTEEDDPNYDFLQAQLSPDIHKRKAKKQWEDSSDELAADHCALV